MNIKRVQTYLQFLSSFRFRLYSAYSRVGLVVKHSAFHIPPNYRDIPCWVADLSVVLCPDTKSHLFFQLHAISLTQQGRQPSVKSLLIFRRIQEALRVESQVQCYTVNPCAATGLLEYIVHVSGNRTHM